MGKTILVVDDSATMRQQVGWAVQQAGFDVVEARDGLEGIDRLKNVANIALVVCDVNMPNMNGLEMIEQVQKEGKYTSIPIILLTTEGQPEQVARAKKAGAKAWIVKPFKAELLVAAVNKLTHAV
jgi:two-component system, chemotaxis family, chemotaxis protein CheY